MTHHHPLQAADLASLLAMSVALGLDDSAAWPAPNTPPASASTSLSASAPAPVPVPPSASAGTPAIAFPHATFDEMFGSPVMPATSPAAVNHSPLVGETASLHSSLGVPSPIMTSSTRSTEPPSPGTSRKPLQPLAPLQAQIPVSHPSPMPSVQRHNRHGPTTMPAPAAPLSAPAHALDVPALDCHLEALESWPSLEPFAGFDPYGQHLTGQPRAAGSLQQDIDPPSAARLWDSLFTPAASTSCSLPVSPPRLLESGLPIPADGVAGLPEPGLPEAGGLDWPLLRPSLSQPEPIKLEELQEAACLTTQNERQAQASSTSTPASMPTPATASSPTALQWRTPRQRESPTQQASKKLVRAKSDPYGAGRASSPSRPHQCLECPRAFERLSNLHQHIPIHDPDRVRPWQCPIPWCMRAFARRHDAQRHALSRHVKRERLQEEHMDLILSMFPNLAP